MFEVIDRVAKFSVSMSSVVGGYPMSLANDMLITIARTFGGSEIEEMDRELTRMIEDFDRAVNVEALHRTRETDKRTNKGGR